MVMGIPETPEGPDPYKIEFKTDLERIRPTFQSVEDYLKSYWHDPRFALRFAIGFLQLLQDEEMTVERIVDMSLADVTPVVTL